MVREYGNARGLPQIKGQLRSIILSRILILQVSGGVLFKKSNKVSRDFAFCGTSNDKLYYREDWDLLCIFDANMNDRQSFGGLGLFVILIRSAPALQTRVPASSPGAM